MRLSLVWVVVLMAYGLGGAAQVDWGAMKTLSSQLQGCVDKKNVDCTARTAQSIWKMIPERSRLYYAGIVVGESAGISAGTTDHWIQNGGYHVRTNIFENGPGGALEIDRELKGLTVLYTGNNETIITEPLGSWLPTWTKEGNTVVHGFEDMVRLSDRQGAGENLIFVDHGRMIKEYANSYLIAVDAKYWNFKELVKSGPVNFLTGVVEEVMVAGKAKRVFKTSYMCVLIKSDTEKGFVGHSVAKTDTKCEKCETFVKEVFQ